MEITAHITGTSKTLSLLIPKDSTLDDLKRTFELVTSISSSDQIILVNGRAPCASGSTHLKDIAGFQRQDTLIVVELNETPSVRYRKKSSLMPHIVDGPVVDEDECAVSIVLGPRVRAAMHSDLSPIDVFQVIEERQRIFIKRVEGKRSCLPSEDGCCQISWIADERSGTPVRHLTARMNGSAFKSEDGTLMDSLIFRLSKCSR